MTYFELLIFFVSYQQYLIYPILALEKAVREQRVLYGKHMDITSYDGKRETHNPEGKLLFFTSKRRSNVFLGKNGQFCIQPIYSIVEFLIQIMV